MMTSYTADNWPSQRWPNFAQREMICSHSGECRLDPTSMDCLQRLRSAVGLPLPVSSAYRSPDHPVEASKERSFSAMSVRRAMLVIGIDSQWPGAVRGPPPRGRPDGSKLAS